MRGSVRPVMMNLMLGIPSVNRPMTESGEDVVEVPALFGITLAGPGEPVQPVDGGQAEVFGPRLYLV